MSASNKSTESKAASKSTPASTSAVEETTTAQRDAADPTATPLPPEEMGNSIPKTSYTSAVTSDLPQEADPATAQDNLDKHAENMPVAHKNSIGLIHVDGNDFRYVGQSPMLEDDPTTETGQAIGAGNSTFTPLSEVPFHPSIRCKDPKSGTFYFPQDGATRWEDVEFDGSKLLDDAEATPVKGKK